MQKQAPSIGRILVAVGFALSCFGLLLFLWITFGGPIPFKPESYRFTADFPEAITLQKEADVRIGGVSVGKVKDISLAPPISDDPTATPAGDDRDRPAVRADLLRRRGDPATEDAARRDLRRAHHRQPVQPGQSSRRPAHSPAPSTSASSPAVTRRIRSRRAAISLRPRSRTQTQIDEIFHGFDKQTREAFRPGCRTAPIAVNGRGLDLNDAFGNLGPVRLRTPRRARHPPEPGAVSRSWSATPATSSRL